MTATRTSDPEAERESTTALTRTGDSARGQKATAPRWISALPASIAVAGGIHLAVGSRHGVTDAQGGFLVVVGLAQVAIAAALVRCCTRRRLSTALVLSTAVAGLWIVTHVPAVIPSGVGAAAGVTATALEFLTALLAAVALRRPDRIHVHARGGTAFVVAGLATLATVTFADSTHSHDHDHDHEPRAASTEPAVTAKPIFGELFSDHDDTPPTDDHDEPHNH